jgi:hypothetical protein
MKFALSKSVLQQYLHGVCLPVLLGNPGTIEVSESGFAPVNADRMAQTTCLSALRSNKKLRPDGEKLCILVIGNEKQLWRAPHVVIPLTLTLSHGERVFDSKHLREI